MLTSKQKSYLRSLGQNVKPIMQVGKNGLTPNFIDSFNQALEDHELVKVSVLKNCLDEKGEIGKALCEETGCELVQVIGNQILFYRESMKENKNDKILLP